VKLTLACGSETALLYMRYTGWVCRYRPQTIVYKNYVIEIMAWKFIYTYRERCKTGLAHNWCWNWNPFTSKHTWMRFSKFWNTFPKVSTSTAWIPWRIVSLSCSIVRGVFFTLCPSIGPKERSRQALAQLPLVSNVLTNFWMQHFDGARLSTNSGRNAVWHALNEPVCQYLRARNPRCSTVYIDNSLGSLARDTSCTVYWNEMYKMWVKYGMSKARFILKFWT